MTVNAFIPQVWSARLLENLHKEQVWTQADIINRDYEGEIANAGDTVRILAIGPVTVGTYTKATSMGSPQRLDGGDLTLVIDQSDFFHFAIDDVDGAQSKPKFMDAAMQESAYALSDKADTFVATLALDAAPANIIGTNTAPKTDLGTSGKAYEYLVDLGVLLDEARIPTAGRWCIISPWYHGVIRKDTRFVGYGTDAQQDALRNGKVGSAAGFTLYKSLNVKKTGASSDVFNITAGYRGAIGYADNITRNEAYRIQDQFGDAMKGLHLYGGKVLRPQGLAILKCQRPT